MKTFEPVYMELEDLFIQKLPAYIENINKEYKDGFIIKRFENHTITEDCIKLPNFKFSLEESEYTEKDRIIEKTVYIVSFEIKLTEYDKAQIIVCNRYLEAVYRMFDETESEINYQITKIKKNKIYLKIFFLE